MKISHSTNSEFLLREFIRNINYYKLNLNEGKPVSAANQDLGAAVAKLTDIQKHTADAGEWMKANEPAIQDLMDSMENTFSIGGYLWVNDFSNLVDSAIIVDNTNTPTAAQPWTLGALCYSIVDGDYSDIVLGISNAIKAMTGQRPIKSINEGLYSSDIGGELATKAMQIIKSLYGNEGKFASAVSNIKSLDILTPGAFSKLNANPSGGFKASAEKFSLEDALQGSLENTYRAEVKDDEVVELLSRLRLPKAPTVTEIEAYYAVDQSRVITDDEFKLLKDHVDSVRAEITKVASDPTLIKQLIRAALDDYTAIGSRVPVIARWAVPTKGSTITKAALLPIIPFLSLQAVDSYSDTTVVVSILDSNLKTYKKAIKEMAKQVEDTGESEALVALLRSKLS